MFSANFIQNLSQRNVSVNGALTKERVKEILKKATPAQRDNIEELAGLKRVSIDRAYKTGNISAKIAVSIAQTLNVDPLYLIGGTESPGECTDNALNEFVMIVGVPDEIIKQAKLELKLKTKDKGNGKGKGKGTRKPSAASATDDAPVATLSADDTSNAGAAESVALGEAAAAVEGDAVRESDASAGDVISVGGWDAAQAESDGISSVQADFSGVSEQTEADDGALAQAETGSDAGQPESITNVGQPEADSAAEKVKPTKTGKRAKSVKTAGKAKPAKPEAAAATAAATAAPVAPAVPEAPAKRARKNAKVKASEPEGITAATAADVIAAETIAAAEAVAAAETIAAADIAAVAASAEADIAAAEAVAVAEAIAMADMAAVAASAEAEIAAADNTAAYVIGVPVIDAIELATATAGASADGDPQLADRIPEDEAIALLHGLYIGAKYSTGSKKVLEQVLSMLT